MSITGEVLGFGPRTLVFIHGWGTSRNIWQQAAAALAINNRCILVDLWGHGRSGLPPGSYDPSLISDLSAILSDSGDVRAVVIAQGFGAVFALDWARVRPDEVSGVILIDGPHAIDVEHVRTPRNDSCNGVEQFGWMRERAPAVAASSEHFAFYREAFLMDRRFALTEVKQPTVSISTSRGEPDSAFPSQVSPVPSHPVGTVAIVDTNTGAVSAGQSVQVARLLDAALQELHVSISRRLSSASNDYFTNQADAYASSRSHSQHGLERIAGLLECQRGSRVLDIGTGPGHAALRLAEDGLTIDAVDPCARMLSVGARRSMERGLSESVRFYQAEATALPFIDDLFDGAIARMTTHHVWNLASALEEVRRTLKSGGHFVIIDNIGPEDRELFRHIERLERLKDSSHARLYSLAEWFVLLARTGFDLVSCDVDKVEHSVEEWSNVASLSAAARALAVQWWDAADARTKAYFNCITAGAHVVSFTMDRMILVARARLSR